MFIGFRKANGNSDSNDNAAHPAYPGAPRNDHNSLCAQTHIGIRQIHDMVQALDNDLTSTATFSRGLTA